MENSQVWQDLMDDYTQDGYLLVRNALSPADLEPMRTLIARKIDAHARQLFHDGHIPSAFDDEPFGRRLVRLYENSELRLRSWADLAVGRALYDLARHPRIVNVLEPLLGPHISFNGDFHVRPKMPNSTLTAFPWHQDSQYYGKPSQHTHIVTVWIPLVEEVTQDNGCLHVMPGSHRWGLLDSARDVDMNMHTFEDISKRGESRPLPMKMGDILLFSNLTFHRSTVNRSNAVRWSIDLRYTETRGIRRLAPQEQEAADHIVTLVRRRKSLPLVVRGQDKQMTFDEWKTAIASNDP